MAVSQDAYDELKNEYKPLEEPSHDDIANILHQIIHDPEFKFDGTMQYDVIVQTLTNELQNHIPFLKTNPNLVRDVMSKSDINTLEKITTNTNKI